MGKVRLGAEDGEEGAEEAGEGAEEAGEGAEEAEEGETVEGKGVEGGKDVGSAEDKASQNRERKCFKRKTLFLWLSKTKKRVWDHKNKKIGCYLSKLNLASSYPNVGS